jgi:hypothetical protein
MDIKQSTTDGNVEVLEDLFRQGGIGDKRDSSFNADHDVDMTEHVILVHGDLLTKERLDTVRNSRGSSTHQKTDFNMSSSCPGYSTTKWRVLMPFGIHISSRKKDVMMKIACIST